MLQHLVYKVFMKQSSLFVQKFVPNLDHQQIVADKVLSEIPPES